MWFIRTFSSILCFAAGVTARGEILISNSIADLSIVAVPSSFSAVCQESVVLEPFSSEVLTCVQETENPYSRAETILNLSTSTNANNSRVSIRFDSESQVSGGFDPVLTRFQFANGTGYAVVGFELSDEPMLVTLSIVNLETGSGSFSFSEVLAEWVLGSGTGSARSFAGQSTYSGDLSGILSPGEQGYVELSIPYAAAYTLVESEEFRSNPSTFARVEISLRFEPAVCSESDSASATAVGEEIFSWNNPAGGSYAEANNWDPQQVPGGSCAAGDTAVFELDGAEAILVHAVNASAGDWRVRNGAYEFNGPATLHSSSTTDVSLVVSHHGQLELVGDSLTSNHSRLGEALGETPGTVIIPHAASYWENNGRITMSNGSLAVSAGGEVFTEELSIGSVSGRFATVSVDGVFADSRSAIDVDQSLTVGGGGAATLNITNGATLFSRNCDIGLSGAGTVVVQGSANPSDIQDSASYAQFIAEESLHIGGVGEGNLRIEKGGGATGNPVNIAPVGNGRSRVVVNGQGGIAVINAATRLSVHGSDQVEVEALDGGRIVAESIWIGGGQSPATAEVTVRGSGNQPDSDLQSFLSTDNFAETLGGPGIVSVGTNGPGQLNLLAGARANFRAGLVVGEAGSGVVLLTSEGAPIGQSTEMDVTGLTEIGKSALGNLRIGDRAGVDTVGDVRIGAGHEGRVDLANAAVLNVNGTVSLGHGAHGSLHGDDLSAIFCNTLIVGSAAYGSLELTDSNLTVHGNAHVGAGPRDGQLVLTGNSLMTIDGTLTIGSVEGAPGTGLVRLFGGTIRGSGSIVVNRDSYLVGTGSVEVCSVCTVNNGGTISPGLSPGVLTIVGNFEQESTGRLEIEFEGTDPGEFDLLEVTETASLGGHLEIHFVEGFSPPDPKAFTASQSGVVADGGLVGDFELRSFVYPDEFADFDDDGDKDLRDVSAFANCFAESGELGGGCERADWERDGVIAGREIQELASRLSGPE